MKSMTGFSIIMLGIFTSLYSPKTIEYCSAMMSQLVIKIFYCFILQSAVPNFAPDGASYAIICNYAELSLFLFLHFRHT